MQDREERDREICLERGSRMEWKQGGNIAEKEQARERESKYDEDKNIK